MSNLFSRLQELNLVSIMSRLIKLLIHLANVITISFYSDQGDRVFSYSICGHLYRRRLQISIREMTHDTFVSVCWALRPDDDS